MNRKPLTKAAATLLTLVVMIAAAPGTTFAASQPTPTATSAAAYKPSFPTPICPTFLPVLEAMDAHIYKPSFPFNPPLPESCLPYPAGQVKDEA